MKFQKLFKYPTGRWGKENNISKYWKQPKRPSVGERLNYLWYIHTMEYYSVIKRDKVLIQATTWMDLQKITLSEKKDNFKRSYCVIPFI